jgi:hypothetical protein
MYEPTQPMERVETIRAQSGGKMITSTIHWDHMMHVLFARRQHEALGEPYPAQAA